MKRAFLLLAILQSCASAPQDVPVSREPDTALRALVEGNERFVPSLSMERREELRAVQRPFAAVLSCADSRVPPEFVFDRGLGDLFVVRVAGNIVDVSVEGSLEYAAGHLGVRLVLVLGHTHCGAVSAALKGGEAEGSIALLVDAIRPAIEGAQARPGDPLENAIRVDVGWPVEAIRKKDPS